MKKSLLTLSAACLALSAMAVAPEQVQIPNLRSFANLSEVQPLNSLTVGHKASMRKAPARLNSEEDVIIAPEGTKQDVTINGSGYYLYWGILLASYANQDSPSNVVYGENNEVYICDILPNTGLGTYTKGTVNGDEVTIDLPQTLYYDSDYEQGYTLTMFTYEEWQEVDENGELVFDENGEAVMQATYVEDENPGSITFNIDADGKWTTSALDGSGDKLLGLALYSEEETGWMGYGAFDLSITPFDGKLVEVPEDIEVSENFWSFIAGDYGWTVSFAQGYDEIYFQGISSQFPEAWLMATVEYGDTEAIVSFPQNQYVGIYADSYYIYTKYATYDGEVYTLMPDDYQYELVWDYEENTLKAKDRDVYFIFNAAQDRVYYLEMFQNLSFLHQESFEGTPAAPNNLSFNYTMDDYGYDGFYFTVPSISTDGELLLTDNLYYVVYVDGEEWTCDADEYLIDESLTEIPWNFSAYYIYNYGGADREVDFFVEGISSVGVQSIYYYNGEETRSEIVTLSLDPSAVKAVDSDKEVAKVVYFDLAGRAVANPTNGLYIKRTTYTDGTTVSAKKFVR